MLRKGEDEHMPLTMAKTGEECTIKKAGNLSVSIKESRVAIDKTMANKIMV